MIGVIHMNIIGAEAHLDVSHVVMIRMNKDHPIFADESLTLRNGKAVQTTPLRDHFIQQVGNKLDRFQIGALVTGPIRHSVQWINRNEDALLIRALATEDPARKSAQLRRIAAALAVTSAELGLSELKTALHCAPQRSSVIERDPSSFGNGDGGSNGDLSISRYSFDRILDAAMTDLARQIIDSLQILKLLSEFKEITG